MSTLTVADIPLDADSPAQRLRRMAAAVRVHFTWWGVHRTLTTQQKEEVGAAYAADARFLTAGKKILDIRHEAFRRLTSLRTRIVSYWRGLTLPYVEPGVRLIRQADIEVFVHTLEGFREELTQAEVELNAVYEQIQADAQRRLGRLYNPARLSARGAQPVRRGVGFPHRRAARLSAAHRSRGLRAGAGARRPALRGGGAPGRAGVCSASSPDWCPI